MSASQRRRVAATFTLLAIAAAPAPAQSISSASPMSFGSFIAGGGGTLTVSPGGLRSQTGTVVLVGQVAGYSAAQLNVSGTANAGYTITLPSNNSVVLMDADSHTMALNFFVSSPSSGLLSGGGAQTIRIGATLVVGNGQPPGSYSGTFNVTVNY